MRESSEKERDESLRFRCLDQAVKICNSPQYKTEDVLEISSRMYQFVKTGDVNPKPTKP